ncbi:unnamed protein product [Menidia menidia]|uniref:(Atlantic silverside) hypothetical protein n=1 Tax=Menidia menidia TaxID=238744 RepID=A0A8S4B018_9TELE|nr:unnamed protein product [Menidia menidia]
MGGVSCLQGVGKRKHLHLSVEVEPYGKGVRTRDRSSPRTEPHSDMGLHCVDVESNNSILPLKFCIHQERLNSDRL